MTSKSPDELAFLLVWECVKADFEDLKSLPEILSSQRDIVETTLFPDWDSFIQALKIRIQKSLIDLEQKSNEQDFLKTVSRNIQSLILSTKDKPTFSDMQNKIAKAVYAKKWAKRINLATKAVINLDIVQEILFGKLTLLKHSEAKMSSIQQQLSTTPYELASSDLAQTFEDFIIKSGTVDKSNQMTIRSYEELLSTIRFRILRLEITYKIIILLKNDL